MESPWDKGTKVCSNGLGHLNKMAAIPIYGKNLKNLLRNQKADDLETWYAAPASRYLDYLINIDTPYFEGMVNRIYQPELQLNKANTSDTEAPFLDLHLSISNGFVSSKVYDKRDDFDFDPVNFPFLMVTFPILPLTGFTFLNLSGLLECLVMWLISMPVIKV